MIRTIALFTLFLALAQARNITFSNCTPNGKILNVNVVPCDTDPCKFTPGQQVRLDGSFSTSIATSNPTLQTEIQMGDAWVQYPDVDTDACKFTKCPIEANVNYPYAVGLHVIDWPVSFKTQMRFRLLGDDGSTELVCGLTTIAVAKE